MPKVRRTSFLRIAVDTAALNSDGGPPRPSLPTRSLRHVEIPRRRHSRRRPIWSACRSSEVIQGKCQWEVPFPSSRDVSFIGGCDRQCSSFAWGCGPSPCRPTATLDEAAKARVQESPIDKDKGFLEREKAGPRQRSPKSAGPPRGTKRASLDRRRPGTRSRPGRHPTAADQPRALESEFARAVSAPSPSSSRPAPEEASS